MERKPDEIFHEDVMRQQLAMIHKNIGNESGSERERNAAHRIAAKQILNEEWELIRGSMTDCIRKDRKGVEIMLPLTYQANDKDARIRELFGRMTLYRLMADEIGFDHKIRFSVCSDRDTEEIMELVDKINHE